LNSEGFNLWIKRVSEDTYEIHIEGEDDTIGHLVSTYLELSDRVQLSYYKRPHPLEEKIIIYVRLKNKNDNIRDVLEEVIGGKLLSDINDLRERYLEALRKAGVSEEDLGL
jgi:DNA-directed RNA polymerase subunit L